MTTSGCEYLFHIMQRNPYHVEKGQLISWRMSDLTIFAQLRLEISSKCVQVLFSTSFFILSESALKFKAKPKEWALGVFVYKSEFQNAYNTVILETSLRVKLQISKDQT